jgi:site-specific DNA recombinase
MSPSWARKGSRRWRYYVSQAALQGDKSKAGSVVQVAVTTVEHFVGAAISRQSTDHSSSQADLRSLIDRVTIGRTAIQVQLSEAAEADLGARTLTVPWTPPSPYRKREIIRGARDPDRSPSRRSSVAGRTSLRSPPNFGVLGFAREDKTVRSIPMTLSLAFLAPEIVKTAAEVHLPHRVGCKRLVDLPIAWPDQWRVLGHEVPAMTAW